MDKTISLKYIWKNEYIIQAYKYHRQSSRNYRRRNAVCFVIGIAQLIFALYKIFVEHDLPALIFMVSGIYLLLINKIQFYFYYRNLQRLNYENKQIEWKINAEKIIHRILNISESTFSWDLIYGVLDTPEGFLLYPQQHMFYWLPKKAFANEEDFAQFAYLAHNKVQNWQQIK